VGDAERSGVDEGPDGYAGAEDAGVSAADVGGTVDAGRGIGKVGGDVAEEDGCFVAGKPGEERLDLLEDSDGGSLPATMVGGEINRCRSRGDGRVFGVWRRGLGGV